VQVRCSSYDKATERLVTMDVTGRVLLWDPVGAGDMRVVRQFQLPTSYKEECTCMLLSENMLMAGAKEYLTIYDPRRPAPVLSLPVAKLGYSRAFHVYPQTVAARSLAVNGCLLSVGLSTTGAVMCLDKRMLTSGSVAPAALEASKGCISPNAIRRAASALAACVTPAPRLPAWLHSQCRSEVIFAGARRHPSACAHVFHALLPHSLACVLTAVMLRADRSAATGTCATAPPMSAKAARYNLRQRSKLKAPPRFATSSFSMEHGYEAEFALGGAPATSIPNSNHTLDLTRLIQPCAVLRQPRSEVHVDDMVNQGWVVDNAIFSHAWSPDGCAMFSCGGPLAMGVRGCYMALWC
jgi:hypothetical protein